MVPYTRGAQKLREIPRRQRLLARPSLASLFKGVATTDRSARNRQIRRAHLKHGYTLSEIGRHLNLHYSTISKIISAQD